MFLLLTLNMLLPAEAPLDIVHFPKIRNHFKPFFPMHPFSTPVFLMFSGGRESVHSEQMGQSCYLRTNNRKMNMFLEKHIYSASPYQNIIQ